MLVVSNMYPDAKHPSYGIFVKRFVEQSNSEGFSISLSVMRKSDVAMGKLIRYALFYLCTFTRIIFQSYDVVYVHYPSYSFAPVFFARRFRRFNLIVNVHGSDVLPITDGQKRMHRYTVSAMKAADRVVTPSEYFEKIVIKKYGLDPSKVYVYPSGGVDPKIFHPLSENRVREIKSALGLEPNLVTVCFAGRITEGKGWDTYLAAIAEVFEQGQKLNALLIGSGDQDSQCADLLKRLGLSNLVVHLGLQTQERLCELYNAADIFVFPGRRYESLGLVAIEAMACGTPVIASDLAAPKYYIKNGTNGMLVPPGDSHAIATILGEIAAGSLSTDSLRHGALKTARLYSGEHLRRQYEAIFEENSSRTSEVPFGKMGA